MSAILGIIKSHEGALQLSSTPGVGTTFVVYLPTPAEVDRTEITLSPRVDMSMSAAGTVLLVDDEDALRAIGSALLGAMGFTVVTASNGREAIELYREKGEGIDVVLLDMVMPEMGGIEAYHKLRAIDRRVPVVICSGYGVDGLLDSIDADRNVRCIQKPYKPEQLRSTILDVLGTQTA
jgi:CheY-like chemotaxis protein